MHIACNHGNNIWRKPGIDPHETITNALKYINFKDTSFLLATNEPSDQKRSKM